MAKVIAQIQVQYAQNTEVESSEVFEAKTLAAAKRKANAWFSNAYIEMANVETFTEGTTTYMIAQEA